jgi:predicted transcriptional regulator/DNA-directed RNA polymerase subunit RPC12/RpoP
MTTKLSPCKLSRLLSLHFEGYSQVQIAHKLNLDQSTVSLYITKFGMQSQAKGLMAAAKEMGIMDIVTSLHSLAAELQASHLSAEEAKPGLKARLKLEKCGVGEEQYPDMISAVEKMKQKGFLQSALKLVSLENSTGMDYAGITSKYEQISGQIEQKSQKLAELNAAMLKQQAALKTIEDKRKEREMEYNEYLKKTDMNMLRLIEVEKISVLLKKAGIKDSELKVYIGRQQELDSCSLDINLFGQIVSKAAAATSKDGGKQLLNMLAEYGSLQEADNKMAANKADLEKQLTGLSDHVKENNRLMKEVANLTEERDTLYDAVKDFEAKVKIKDDLVYEIQSLENTRHGTQMDIKSLQNQKLALEAEVVATKEKLTGLQPLETQYKELTGRNDELAKAFAEKSKQFEMFKAFMGFLQNTTFEALEEFVRLAPEMVRWAKQGKYSPEQIKKSLLDDLTMGQMNLYGCMICKTRFFIDSSPSWKKNFSCPNCNNMSVVLVKTDAQDALSQMTVKTIQV